MIFSPENFKQFAFGGRMYSVRGTGRLDVAEGVVCHTYDFVETRKMDLGIICVEPGYKTPLQEVLSGEATYEGFFGGVGSLEINRRNGVREIYLFLHKELGLRKVRVDIGDKMQWMAKNEKSLTAWEICIPKYREGRFRNLS